MTRDAGVPGGHCDRPPGRRRPGGPGHPPPHRAVPPIWVRAPGSPGCPGPSAGPGGVDHTALRLPYDRLRNLSVSVALTLDLLRQAMLKRT